MGRPGSQRRWRPWIVALAVVAVAALAAPFIIERRVSYYTDGENVRAPESEARDSIREILWEEPRDVGPQINAADSDEYEPCVSPDGDLLVFTRGRAGGDADLWAAARSRGRWVDPQPLGALNTPADELGAAFSPDGDLLFFSSDRDGGHGGHDIWVSVRAGDGSWSAPENAGAAVNTAWNELDPAPSADGARLYFTSDRRAGEERRGPWTATIRARLRSANYDIFVADRVPDPVVDGAATGPSIAGSWTLAPARALLALNGAWAEGATAVSPARDFLYFASNRPGGAGGFDLYRVRLIGGETTVPESLGPLVNSTAHELDPALSSGGFELYFARERDGHEDIFVTRSREVFVTREREGPYWSLAAVLAFLADLIAAIPTGLLILLLYLLFCLLFLRLLRGRLGTLNLLARCFLIAILVHLLLALWMNRHRVHRVLLQALDVEEKHELFEIAVEGLPEEEVGVDIREAVASAGSDELPSLGAELVRRPPPRDDTQMRELERVEPLTVTPLRSAELPTETPLDAPAPVPELTAPATTALPDPQPLAADLDLDRAPPVEPRDTPAPEAATPVVPELDSSRRQRDRVVETPVASARVAPAPATLPPLDAPLAPVAPPLPARGESLPEERLPEALPPDDDTALPDPTANVAIERERGPPAAEPAPETPTIPRRRPEPRRVASRRDEVATARHEITLAAVTPVTRAPPTREPEGRPSPSALADRPGAVTPSPVAPSRREEPPGTTYSPRPVAVATPPAPDEAGRQPTRPVLERRRASPRRRTSRPGPHTEQVAAVRTPSRPAAVLAIDRGPRRRDLERNLARIDPAGDDAPRVVVAATRRDDAASDFLPRIYRLRRQDARAEALRRGGGSEATERAVRAGLDWLARHQSPDGRWRLDHYTRHLREVSPRDLHHPDWNGRGRRSSVGGRDKAKNGDTAATGLALLAFLGHGESHLEDGPHRENIARGLRFLLSRQKQNGDLRGGGNLYMHAIAAFALCEAYAFTRDPELREAAQRAIDFTVRSQNPRRGGWRYAPYPSSDDVDTSVFGWMLMALKSGHLGGLEVDEDCLLRAASYLSAARMGDSGRYAYQPGRSRSSIAMTAQGLFSLQMLSDTLLDDEERQDPRLAATARPSVDFLLRNLPRAADMEGVNFYYWYYGSLALFQVGGEPWRRWNERLGKLLIEHQVGEEHGSARGSWDPRGRRAETGGRVYSTALSILCLEVYYRYARR